MSDVKVGSIEGELDIDVRLVRMDEDMEISVVMTAPFLVTNFFLTKNLASELARLLDRAVGMTE